MCLKKFLSRPKGKIPLIHITTQEEYYIFRNFLLKENDIKKTFELRKIIENEIWDKMWNVFDIEDGEIGVGVFESTKWEEYPQYVFKPFHWFFTEEKKKFIDVEE